MQRSSELSSALEHALPARKAKAEDGKALSFLPVFHGLWRSLWVRALLLLAAYCLILALARWVALILRFESDVPAEYCLIFQQAWFLELGVKLLFLVLFGQLSGLLSYFSVPDLRRLFYGTAAASGFLLLTRYLFSNYYGVPRGYLLIDWLLSFGGLAL